MNSTTQYHRVRIVKAGLAAALAICMTVASAQDWREVRDPSSIMEEGYIQVIGSSEERQTRYRALRAATVVAQRDLLESFQGLTVAGSTTVADGMLESDTIATQVKGYLRGAVKCGEKYNGEKGYAEVCMRLYIRGKGGAYDVILPLLSKEGLLARAAPQAPEFVPEKPASAPQHPEFVPEPPPVIPQVIDRQPGAEQAASGAPASAETPLAASETTQSVQVAPPSQLVNPSDGLVLDVGGLGFKPAIVNRVVTEKGDVVFGPSRVVNSVLIERGCGGFTNQIDKAKGLLATWGSNNPMHLKAVKVQRGTDAVIGVDEAAALYTHDQKTSFLSQAKVVFVIN